MEQTRERSSLTGSLRSCALDHHRRCEPRWRASFQLQRPLQGACAGVGSRLSAVTEEMCLERILCFKTGAESPGTTPDTAGAHFNCCPARTGRPTPESCGCARRTTIAWQCSTRDATSHLRKRHHARVSSGASPGEPRTQITSANGLGSKQAGIWMPTTRSSRHLRPRRHGTSSQNCGSTARKPTPLQTAGGRRCRAKRKGLSMRGIGIWVYTETVTCAETPVAPFDDAWPMICKSQAGDIYVVTLTFMLHSRPGCRSLPRP